MHSTLLRAKLHRPTPSTGAIARQRLLDRLREGLACKATLVSAAAGFGKSTLLSTWLAQLVAPADAQQNGTLTAAGWLTLDRSDDDLPRFLRYLVAVVEDSFPHLCDPLTVLLRERQNETDQAMARLAKAMQIAVPNGIVGRFIQRGQPMQRLLQAFCNHPAYNALAPGPAPGRRS